MPVACVHIPHFALRAAILERPELDGTPLVLGPAAGGRPLVADATPEAAAGGVRPGMNLREATKLCPEAVALTPDPAHQTRVWERLLSRLDALSPLVEAAEPGTAYLDLNGSARSLGPPKIAARRLLAAALPALRPRVGIAPGKFAALAAARAARPGGARVVASVDLAAFLAGLPADWLPLPPDRLAQLRRLGLATMGDLAALPPAAVAGRLGPAGRRAWTLAGGLPDRDTLLRHLGLLVERAFGDEALRGRAGRRATLRVALDAGGSWERSFALKDAAGADRLLAALRLRLGRVELPGAVAALRLEVAGVAGEATRQERLPGLLPRRPAPLAEAIRSLSSRYGESPIYRVVGVEPWSRIPERRYALAPYDP